MEGKKQTGRKSERTPEQAAGWPGWTGFGEKTVWDWLQILIVPLVLAVVGFWFTMQQDARQQRIEDQRAKSDRQIEEQRSQDATLQSYLDQMSILLLERNLRSSDADSGVSTLGRARTLTALERLDPDRRAAVLQFLYEADLLNQESATLDMSNATLSGIDLSNQLYSGIDLFGANLSNATLRGAILGEADLSHADLSDADLSGTNLTQVSLVDANLDGANLSGTCGVTKERLESDDVSIHGINLENANTQVTCQRVRHEDVMQSIGDIR